MEKLSNTIAGVREQIGAWSSSVLIVLVLSFLFFVTGGGISHNAKWRIERIDVVGTKSVSEDVVRTLVRQKLEGNYFFVYARENSRLFPIVEIEQMLLETFPRIQSVFVERVDNHAIVVAVAERKPYALWCGDVFNAEMYELNNCWFIDENGFVFDRAPIFSRGVYMEVYGKLVEKNTGDALRASLPYSRYTTANTFAKDLTVSVGKPLRIAIKPEGELEATIYSSTKYPFLSGVTIRFKDESNPEILIKNLLSAIPVQFPGNIAPKKKLLYIDMRFGNKVIFGSEN